MGSNNPLRVFSPPPCLCGESYRRSRGCLSCTGRALLLALLATTAAARSSPASSDATRARLEQTERDRAAALAAQKDAAAKAAAAGTQAAQLAASRAAALSRLQQAEQATAEAATRMEALAGERRDAEERLAARAKAIEPLLPLVERLSLYPAETMLAVPLPPSQAIRGVLVLQGVAHEIAEQAAALQRERAALRAARDAVAAEAPHLAQAEAAQANAAAALDRQLAVANASQRRAETEAAAAGQRAADLAAQAATLRGLVDKLEQAKRREAAQARADAARRRTGGAGHQVAFAPTAPESMAPDAHPRGQLLVPVTGRVVRGWGEPTDAGPASGISYRPAPSARVVAPCGGRVLFAAPFRSYGRLVILDCGGGYDVVLAGFANLAVKLGQIVQKGDPVGTMPDWNPAARSNPPTLYVELRRGGEAVNPAPWFKPVAPSHAMVD